MHCRHLCRQTTARRCARSPGQEDLGKKKRELYCYYPWYVIVVVESSERIVEKSIFTEPTFDVHFHCGRPHDFNETIGIIKKEMEIIGLKKVLLLNNIIKIQIKTFLFILNMIQY